MKEKYEIYEVVVSLEVMEDVKQNITWVSYGKDSDEATLRTLDDITKLIECERCEIISVKLKNDDWGES